jgi:hypothetical protein
MTFPSNPTTGQTFKPTPEFPVTYTWTGYAWKAIGSSVVGSSRGMTFTDDPPAKADSLPGALWVQKSSGNLFAFIDDGDDCHWVQIN